jgi:lysylphosphatidylglycerol synthetase-like protein (DUF2156 family)
MNNSLVQERSSMSTLRVHNNTSRNSATIFTKLIALLAFEGFNYLATVFALSSLFGIQATNDMTWAAVLAVAFCFIDVTGIVSFYIPSRATRQTKSDRRLVTAWLLAAGLNTLLTWYGIATAILVRQFQTGWIVDSNALVKILPVSMTIIIWLIRVLIIGSFSHPDRNTCEQTYLSDNLPIGADLQPSKECNLLEMAPNDNMPQYRQSFPTIKSTPFKPEPTYRGIPIRYRTS